MDDLTRKEADMEKVTSLSQDLQDLLNVRLLTYNK